MTFSPHAERWLTPGTEYAVTEKLPLPKEWYKNWDLDKASSAPSTGTNIDSDEQEESECPAAIPSQASHAHCEARQEAASRQQGPPLGNFEGVICAPHALPGCLAHRRALRLGACSTHASPMCCMPMACAIVSLTYKGNPAIIVAHLWQDVSLTSCAPCR